MRTQYCGEVCDRSIDKKVALCGWVQSRRDHGGVIFIDLRDRTGIVQIVFSPDNPLFKEADRLRDEFVIRIEGKVRKRPEGTVNPNLATGSVEVVADSMTLLNQAKTPPFAISEFTNASEEVRLKFRHLDLRRPQLQKNLILRHRVAQVVREFLNNNGFLEIETPILTKSTPEGARDFLVPSRLSPGNFYALPQSPQLFKQILMIGGFDRYYQIARCFRDEDLRADRQPEFTQIDLEMSFIDEKDIMSLIEKMMALIFKEALGMEIKLPLPVMSYKEARSRFGIDRPDLRIPSELKDFTPIFAGTKFERFKKALDAKGSVKGLLHKGGASLTRKEVDELTQFAISVGAKGLAWLKWTQSLEAESPIAKFFSPEEIKALKTESTASAGDILFLVADSTKSAENVLGALRIHLWNNFIVKGKPPSLKESTNLLWVADFPLFEWSDEDKRWVSVHHPFTSPRIEDMAALAKLNPLKEVPNPDSILGTFKARAYDIVLNGTELGGGSIRNHNPQFQQTIFNLLGLSAEEISAKFGFLIEALESGAPPHGGIALGLDRIIAILSGEDSIRDVIAFPKTQKGTCLMSGAPSFPDPKILRELGLPLPVQKPSKEKAEKGTA